MKKNKVKTFDSIDLSLFGKEFHSRLPVILKGVDIGECTSKWDINYLSNVFGERLVKVHVAPEPKMDFINKNFQYKTLPFNEFLKRVSSVNHEDYFISPQEKYYLRSLGDDVRKDIADVQKQFPALANDLKIPYIFEKEKFFSSVFRITSPSVQLWTHYDVMDNVLIQVSGHKKVVLFPPKDTLNLYLIGDKSEVMDIEDPDFEKFPRFNNVEWFECILEPKDVLFIPALWFHNVTALDFSVSVNVFWKHLANELYDSKDVYGNKDLIPAQRAMQGIEKSLKNLSTLPEEYKDFFCRRLISKIENSLIS